MKKIISVLCIVSFLSGCEKNIESYELKDISIKCGGMNNIHQLWKSFNVTQARCTDGKMVVYVEKTN